MVMVMVVTLTTNCRIGPALHRQRRQGFRIGGELRSQAHGAHALPKGADFYRSAAERGIHGAQKDGTGERAAKTVEGGRGPRQPGARERRSALNWSRSKEMGWDDTNNTRKRVNTYVYICMSV